MDGMAATACSVIERVHRRNHRMEIAVRHQLRSEYLFSKSWCALCYFVSVPGALYNREAFPRKRGFASWRADSHIGGFGTPGSFDRRVPFRLKPTHSLRQRGAWVSFPGAPITRQGSGRHGRHCLRRYIQSCLAR